MCAKICHKISHRRNQEASDGEDVVNGDGENRQLGTKENVIGEGKTAFEGFAIILFFSFCFSGMLSRILDTDNLDYGFVLFFELISHPQGLVNGKWSTSWPPSVVCRAVCSPVTVWDGHENSFWMEVFIQHITMVLNLEF